MARFKAVFLDVGGTLLRMGEPTAAYREILAEHGYTFEPEQIERALRAAREAARAVQAGPAPDFTIVAGREAARRDRMVCELLGALGVAERFELCRQGIWDSWLGTRAFQQFPETGRVMARLKTAGYVLGAISNWEPRLAELCANHGLAKYFDFLLASEAEGHVKPSPVLFEKALRLAGVAPSEAVHVGDSYHEDVQAAEALGITGILLARDGGRPHPHSPTIQTLEALFPLLESAEWIRGRVVSGVGEAARFVQLPWVVEQTRARLGFTPFPGTLNLHLEDQIDRLAWERLRAKPGIPIEPAPGFCAARCYPLLLDGRCAAAAVVPEVQGYATDVIELLARVRLRDELSLKDGAPLTLTAREPATLAAPL